MRSFHIVLVLAVLFAGGFAWDRWKHSAAQGTHSEGKALIGGPFTLTAADGKKVTDQDFRGKFMLVFFGYTHCPDVCPTELQNMVEVLKKLGPNASEVALIFISVDPARDTPEVLSTYIQNFDPRIVALTGSPEEVASAAKAYRVYFKKTDGGPAEYTVDHSAFVYLMDREGNFLSHFMFNASAETVASAIKKYL
jgi:protein SCO1/2